MRTESWRNFFGPAEARALTVLLLGLISLQLGCLGITMKNVPNETENFSGVEAEKHAQEIKEHLEFIIAEIKDRGIRGQNQWELKLQSHELIYKEQFGQRLIEISGRGAQTLDQNANGLENGDQIDHALIYQATPYQLKWVNERYLYRVRVLRRELDPSFQVNTSDLLLNL